MGKEILVGSTGLVGRNLLAARTFDLAVHSTNIDRAFDNDCSLVVYAGVPGTKHLANRNPDDDRQIVIGARENLRCIDADEVVLISTVDVYGDSCGKDENSAPGGVGLTSYGTNRLCLENWVREDFPDALIVRLPAIYGTGLKKNFVHDMMHPAPPMLTDDMYWKLVKKAPLVRDGYVPGENGFYVLSKEWEEQLDSWFVRQPVNALNYTDSRSQFQFYSLSHLWRDIAIAINGGVRSLNIATPPVTASEAYEYIFGMSWTNHLEGRQAIYDMRSIYYPDVGGQAGYLCTKEEELADLKEFVLGGR